MVTTHSRFAGWRAPCGAPLFRRRGLGGASEVGARGEQVLVADDCIKWWRVLSMWGTFGFAWKILKIGFPSLSTALSMSLWTVVFWILLMPFAEELWLHHFQTCPQVILLAMHPITPLLHCHRNQSKVRPCQTPPTHRHISKNTFQPFYIHNVSTSFKKPCSLGV